MGRILANNLLVEGLKNEFADTYEAVRIQQADSKLGLVMDLSQTAENRYHNYAFMNAAPHMEYWRRGESIPTDAMSAAPLAFAYIGSLTCRMVLFRTSAYIWHQMSDCAPPPMIFSGSSFLLMNFSTP